MRTTCALDVGNRYVMASHAFIVMPPLLNAIIALAEL